MRIIIRCDVPDEVTDPDHPMGLTDPGYMELVKALMSLGYDDIEPERDEG